MEPINGFLSKNGSGGYAHSDFVTVHFEKSFKKSAQFPLGAFIVADRSLHLAVQLDSGRLLTVVWTV